MSPIVIVAYRPKPGKAADLLALSRTHVPVLRQQGLVTDRPATLMTAEDGTVIEIFEWKDAAAIEAAHHDAMVQELWNRYAELCDFVPVAQVPEAAQVFSEFTPADG